MNTSNNPSALRSRAEITAALFALMKQHPYNEITVKQIVLEAKIAKKTFYRNFTSKDDVIKAFILGVIKEYSDELKKGDEKSLDIIFRVIEKYKTEITLLDKNDMLYLILLYLNEYLPEIHHDENISRDIPTRYFGGLDPEYLMAFHIGAAWNVVFKWVHKGMTDPPEQIKAVIIKYLER